MKQTLAQLTVLAFAVCSVQCPPPPCAPPSPPTTPGYACKPSPDNNPPFAGWPTAVHDTQLGLEWTAFFGKTTWSDLIVAYPDIQTKHQQDYLNVFNKVMQADKAFIDVVNVVISTGKGDWSQALADVQTALQDFSVFLGGLLGSAPSVAKMDAERSNLADARKAYADMQKQLAALKQK
jgi:hypothetical protein